MNLSQINQKNVLKRWARIQKEDAKKINTNQEEYAFFMSRLLGYLSGDGNLFISKTKNDQRYVISFFPDHLSLIKPFEESCMRLYQKKPITKLLGKYYRMRFYSRIIAEDILKFGTLNTKSWTIPEKLFTNEKNKFEWLKAFFDCEAYVGKNYIKINCVNTNGLKRVKEILKTVGIDSKLYFFKPKNPKWSEYGILVLSRRTNLEKYYNQIGFYHQLKNQKLLNIINK